MTRCIVTFAAALLFALPGLTAQAQRLSFSGGVSGDFAVYDDLGALADRSVAMAEDMEVMKRILDEALEGVYRDGDSKKWVSGDSAGLRAMSLRSLEKVLAQKPRGNQVPDALAAYLDGYGVVCQFTAPPLRKEPEKKKPDSAAVAKPPTRWEATRRRLLGPADDPTETRPGSPESGSSWQFFIGFADVLPTKRVLTEKLLDVLAENGHNFRHLKPDERLTVAITFSKEEKSRGGGERMSGGQMMYGPGGQSAGYGAGFPGGSGGYDSMGMGGVEYGGGMEDMMGSGMMAPGGMMGPGGMEDAPSGMGMGMGMEMMGSGGPGIGVAASEYSGASGSSYGGANPELTTGDLHLRQGNYQKAVDVYENVIRNAVKTDPYKHEPTRKQVPMYQRLIQAQVGAGQYAKAQQLIEAIKDAQARPPSSEKPGHQFPARLVVSATKAQLDQVAAGKMTRQEFDKQARVEYIDPHRERAEKEKAPPTRVHGPAIIDDPALGGARRS